MDERELRQEFLEPGVKFRAKPFWAWNGKLEKEELLRQVNIMKEMGFGGFFMHSRTGLRTEYLGEDWFELINACADEGERLGMEAWLYDEDRYPSGIAGGMVTENEEYRAGFLELSIIRAGEKMEYPGKLTAVFTCQLKDYSFKRLEIVDPDDVKNIDIYMPELSEDGGGYRQAVLIFSIVPSECKEVYNGYSFLDTMNREAVDCFINLTHEKYKEKCQGRLGKSIFGIFTDEPHRGALFSSFSEGKINRVPYTKDLFPVFQERFGYDLKRRLPYLFLREGENAFSKTAMDYIELCQTLFLDNFAKPIQNWCSGHGMIFTGHVLHEDSLSAQTVMQGSLMRFYEYMDYPGIDILTEKNTCWWVVKQVDSVARQIGKPFVLSELYGATGWHMSLEKYKQMGDWQTLFGINLRCPHLLWYTMQGQAKRDYPASIFYQSAWYAEYEKLETYFARAGLFLSQGDAECELLVINPIESVWAYSRMGAFSGLEAVDRRISVIEKRYQDTFQILIGENIEFDYGEESIIERHGNVQKGVLRIGKCSYKKVLVTGLDTIRSSTLALLQEFRKQGGTVIFAGELPGYVDGEISGAVERFAGQCVRTEFSCSDLWRVCRSERGVKVNGEGAWEILSRVKRKDDIWYVMLLNSNRVQGHPDIQIDFGMDAVIEVWDARSGQISHLLPDNRKSGCIEIDFAPGEEKFYRICRSKCKKENEPVVLPYRLSEDNIFVLDMVTAELQDQVFCGEVLKVDRELRRYLELGERSGEMLQPWYIEKKHPFLYEKEWPVNLTFDFQVKKRPDGTIWLAFEDEEHVAEILLNGTVCAQSFKRQWIDLCFSCICLPADAVKEGENQLVIRYHYQAVNGVEAVYLLGEFGVNRNPESGVWEMAELLPKISTGDITDQGLPFYSGKIEYIFSGLDGRCRIQNLKFSGSCIKVKGKEEKLLLAPPYVCEVEDLNAIEVVLTRRNTFGPLHCTERELFAYGPEAFLTEDQQCQEGYQLLEQGLLEYPEIFV